MSRSLFPSDDPSLSSDVGEADETDGEPSYRRPSATAAPRAGADAKTGATGTKPDAAKVAPKDERTAKPVPFAYSRELNSYAELKTKVLPNADEEAAKKALLNNPAFLKSLADRLVKTPLMPLGEQDAALDLLVDALQSGDRAVASEAIRTVVADAQVENPATPAPAREQMAGIKAELLYHWTAIEPDEAGRVNGMLPGPVSRKIWYNVTEAHKHNLAESER